MTTNEEKEYLATTSLAVNKFRNVEIKRINNGKEEEITIGSLITDDEILKDLIESILKAIAESATCSFADVSTLKISEGSSSEETSVSGLLESGVVNIP